MNLAIVTGASSGLGYSIITKLIKDGWEVHGLSRRKAVLESKHYTQHLLDLSDSHAVESFSKNILKDLVQSSYPRVALINNAGSIDPIGALSKHNFEAIQKSFSLNVTTALWLMGSLLKWRQEEVKIVNISSGAASKAYEGWSIYCSAKAALRMASMVTALETKAQVLSYAPGVLDTPMQAELRKSDPKDFPALDRFLNLHESGALIDPSLPAAEICDFLNNELRPGKFVEARYGESL